MGSKNMDQLKKAFRFRGYIDGSENRSITLQQLLQVYRFAQANCRSWGLDAGSLTLHQLNQWVLSPTTAEANSAFMEHLMEKKQPPSWFVIHWPGEPMELFLKSIQLHIATRWLNNSAAFWVCSFANRQHSLQEGMADSPKKSGFFKAMQAARFKVLLVLDASVSPFGRIWCALEYAMCLDRPSALLDVAICRGEQAELITSGLTQQERTAEQYRPSAGVAAKVQRERAFPLDVIEAALSFNIKWAQASIEEDRRCILNFVTGQDPLSEPVAEHDRYDEMNRRIRSLFALTFWRQALASPRPKQEVARASFMTLLRNLAEAICGDEQRRSLSMSLMGCTFRDPETVALVKRSLPPSLIELSLDMRHTDVTDVTLMELAGALPRTLQALSIDLSGCTEVTDNSAQNLARHLPQDLKVVKLELTGTQASPEVVEASRDSSKALLKTGRSSVRSSLRVEAAVEAAQEVDRKSALLQILNTKITLELRTHVVKQLGASWVG